jgi:nitronate monooxygenase
MVLDRLEAPIVLAPLGGGPSTPRLVAEVCEAGGLGFLAGSYLTAEQLHDAIADTRRLTQRPFGVNVFSPVHGPADPRSYDAHLRRLRQWAEDRGVPLGDPRFTDDAFAEKVQLLLEQRPAVVSFSFGCPDPAVVSSLRGTGSEIWVTVTTPAEAVSAAAAGADVLVAQGAEAGGHRGGFADDDSQQLYGLLALLQLIAAEHDTPLVASGGVMTGAGIAAVLCAGARAVQMGTAFMLCPEAGTTPPHRAALRGNAPTTLTRSFSGRLARGIRNEFIEEFDQRAPRAYPEIHYVTAPMRKSGREAGDPAIINLWAGEAYPLARELPARELVHQLAHEAREAAAALARA